MPEQDQAEKRLGCDFLPVLTCRSFSLRLKGRVYQACVRSIMLYGSETWAMKEADLLMLECSDMRMIIKIDDCVIIMSP